MPVQADANERALQPDAPTIDVTPLNGLIGAPLPTDEGAELKMFLNPQAKIGGRLNLTSETLSGSFRIVGLRHDGDSWQGPFSTWTDLRNLYDRSHMKPLEEMGKFATVVIDPPWPI